MPYTPAQCKLFAEKSKRGEKVPKDWKEHCRNPLLELYKKHKPR
jgi:hypothetical protein